MKLDFCTGNIEKFNNAHIACAEYGIELRQRPLDIAEIQSEDAQNIVRDKLQKAYEAVRLPLVVTDDSWEIPGLSGFPGPYMKFINHWFKPEDFLHLTQHLQDRDVYLVQYLGYTNGAETKVFVWKTHGTLLTSVRGTYGAASHKLISLDGDNGLSIAEIYDQGLNDSKRAAAHVWQDFAHWLQDPNK